MNENTFRIALIGALIVVESWEMYLLFRNLHWLKNMTNPPILELSQEDFEIMKKTTENDCQHLLLAAFIGMNANVAKLLFNYFPYIWSISVGHANTSIGRAMCFSVLDSSIIYAVKIPLDFLVALITGVEAPIAALVSGTAYLVISGCFATLGTYTFIYMVDNFGVRNIVGGVMIINAIGFLWMVLFIKFILPKGFALLPDDETGKSVRELANKVGYPVDTVYVNPYNPVPSASYTSALISRCIVISGSLLSTLDAAQVTAVVAHELGHWKYCHTLFDITSSTIQLMTTGYLWISAYGNTTIIQVFQMDASVHPFIPMYIAFVFVYPVFTYLCKGMINIIKTQCEYAADDYACEVWNSNDLRQALVKIAPQLKTAYALDSWYTAWVYGHPSPILRISRIMKKEDKLKDSS